MKAHDQRIDNNRYTVIPRTLAFLLCGEDVLLIRYNQSKGKWASRMNGLGGHIEQGEDPLSAIRRELHEEAGLADPGLELRGTILIDTGERPGIGIYVYLAELAETVPFPPSLEGDLTWIGMDELDAAPLLEDVRVILPEAVAAARSKTTFSASYHEDAAGNLHVDFA